MTRFHLRKRVFSVRSPPSHHPYNITLIGIVALHKDITYEQIVDEVSLSNFLRVRLRELTAQGRINDAENYLFEVLATHVTEEKIAVALEFYADLATLPDAELTAAGFSREEILEGLTEVSKL